MNFENPRLVLTFLGNDLEAGHSTTQTIDDTWIVNNSIMPSRQLLNGLRSSSDQYQLTVFRRCPSVEDIIRTEGNIKAQLYDGDTIKFTGFVSTSYSWAVTDHGEQALTLTLESVGTRLFSQPFIEFGYHFFDTSASAVVYEIISPLGLQIRPGDERKLLQPVKKEVEAGKTCRELLDSLFYECNAVYRFNEQGQLCVEQINADTTGASIINSEHLSSLKGKAISLSKSLRTYKGARVRFTDTATADNYLVYRNTTSQDADHPYCNLRLGAGEWYDGAEIYTAAEWAAATADQFREPTLISAVNAGSESSIVGSGKIIAISNAAQMVVCDSGITVQIEAVGGKWFKITAHNTTNADKYITRMDLYASIVYEKTYGVIRTKIDGPADGKSLLEEEMSWIHDKNNAQKHANLLAQYYKSCGAVYTFYSDLSLTLGSVVELHDDVFSGLDVFVLVYAAKYLTDSDLTEYKAVGVSTFNLDAPVWHGTTGSANPSGAQGPKGEPGATAEIQYALGSSITDPPGEEMQWSSDSMLWDGQIMYWNTGTWGDEVPEMQRGQYIWMRSRIGDAPWQYTRLTGSTSWDNENLGVCTTATPTTSKEGLGLIPGDYFIAGAQFTEDGVTYRKGFAYSYTGTGWSVLDLSDADNSDKALQCLSDLMTSGINVTDSTASIYGWFQNLVAQDAVIGKLAAQEAFIDLLNANDALFENIHISGNSQFDGEISNDAFETYGASSAVTYSGSFSTSIQTGTIKPNTTSSWGDTCKAYCVPTSELVSVFGGSVMDKVACTGTMVIDGVTYTGTADNPIYVSVTLINMAGHRRWSLKQGTYNISWAEYVNYWDFPSGYSSCAGAEVSSSSTPTKGNLTSVSLTSIVSLGGAFTHDLTPKSHLTDTIGTDSNRYRDVFVGTSDFPGITSIAVSSKQGYSRLPNGLILKWGSATTTYNSILKHIITLEVPFPNTLEFFQVFPIGGSYTESGMEWMYSNTGQLRIGKMYDRPGSELTSGQRVFFIALGT